MSENDTSTMDIEEQARKLYQGTALAPMVRASTTPLRTLAFQYGADFVYTEELIDRSLMETTRKINQDLGTVDFVKGANTVSAKTKRRLEREGATPGRLILRTVPSVESGKLICQLGTGEENLALQAAKHVYKDVNAIDINMGCPKKFSVSGGMGSVLLSDPDRASRIIRTLRNELPVPVSAKIRLLKDTASTLDFCQALINAGANAIAIHGRRVGDEATKPAQWDDLREVVTLLRSKHARLPILLNGDFYTRHEWTDFMEETGANGVLLARPALYNPSLFQKPTDTSLPLSTYGYKSPLLLDKTSVIQEYVRHACRYDCHFKNVKYVICEMMGNRRAPIQRVPYLPQKYPDRQTIGSVCNCRNLEDICQVWNVKYSLGGGGDKIQTNTTALAGEHRFEDSYFLDDNKTSGETDTSTSKRPRLSEHSRQ